MFVQLVLQRRVLPRRAERVPREVGELDEQLAGAHGVGADERGDRGERVVDEVRRDLRPQRAHLGAVEPGARLVELGELQLARHVPRDLGGGPQQHRAGRLVGQGGERADDRAVGLQRHHDDAADLAVGGGRTGCSCARAPAGGRCGSPRRPARRRRARGGRRRRPRPGSGAAAVGHGQRAGCRAACAGRAARTRPTTARGPRAARARRARRCAGCRTWPSPAAWRRCCACRGRSGRPRRSPARRRPPRAAPASGGDPSRTSTAPTSPGGTAAGRRAAGHRSDSRDSTGTTDRRRTPPSRCPRTPGRAGRCGRGPAGRSASRP